MAAATSAGRRSAGGPSRWGVAACAAVAGALVAGLTALGSVASAQDDLEPAPRLVILARSDNPADALASGAVGGAFGAPVLLTPPSSLHPATAAALVARQPDVVVLAGGPAALSVAVEQAVADLGFTTRRAAGADRHETAVLVSALLAEWQVPGDRVAGLEDRIAGLEARAAELEATLAGVTREQVGGHDTIRFEAVNVQLVDGTGTTAQQPNGLGNLVIGYNGARTGGAARSGSHYLVIGDGHEWTNYGGIVAGWNNASTGDLASVLGGSGNTASSGRATVVGGFNNTASAGGAIVSGGQGNSAAGLASAVSGGVFNTASGNNASVLGGSNNTAGSADSCVPGC